MNKSNMIEKKTVLEAFEKSLDIVKENKSKSYTDNVSYFLGALEANLDFKCDVDIKSIINELMNL